LKVDRLAAMANSSFLLTAPAATEEPDRRPVSLNKHEWVILLEATVGFALIMGTVWTVKATQRWLFWMSAVWFVGWLIFSAWKALQRGLRLPSAKVTIVMILAGLAVAGALMGLAAALGTLHGPFGRKDPFLHASSYLVWAILQQMIQQTFFLARFERLTHSGLRASLIAASLFGVAHLPNPVLTPVTLAGGWLLSQLYLRYRTVVPLGIAHGFVGMAIAVSVPDHIQHHMRVGLSYLVYPH
jgi:hypothetical protein